MQALILSQNSWYKKLKQLNERLEVCQMDSSTHLPGLYYKHPYEGVLDICAVDLQWVPPRPEYDRSGFLVKSGYRRVISTLLLMKLTTKQRVQKVMGHGYFEHHFPEQSKIQLASTHQRWSEMMQEDRKHRHMLGEAQKTEVKDKIIDKMKEMEIENFEKRGSAALSGDQFIELSEDVKKDQPATKLESLDRAKFDYDKAVGKRKTII